MDIEIRRYVPATPALSTLSFYLSLSVYRACHLASSLSYRMSCFRACLASRSHATVRYDLHAPLQRTPKLLRLQVPGLAEKRPSVQLGDKHVPLPITPVEVNIKVLFPLSGFSLSVFFSLRMPLSCDLRFPSVRVFASFPANPSEEHVGYVHLVEAEHVLLHFNPKFVESYPVGTNVRIRFLVSRVPLRRMHNAVVEWGKGVHGTRQARVGEKEGRRDWVFR